MAELFRGLGPTVSPEMRCKIFGSPRLTRRWPFRRCRSQLIAILAVSVLGALSPLAARPRVRIAAVFVPRRAPRVSGPGSSEDFTEGLRRSLRKVEPLQRAVLEGNIVPRFGRRAAALSAAASVGGVSRGRVVDEVLHGLFVEQLQLLRKREVQRLYERRITPTGLRRAERRFARCARSLVPRGSGWSYHGDLAVLAEDLGALHMGDEAVERERARAARAQRATSDVIEKLQSEVQSSQQRSQGESKAPMALWTSFRVPNSPVRITGRYQESRANIEFQLEPDKDPANAEAGFVEGLTSANWGLSLNVGA